MFKTCSACKKHMHVEMFSRDKNRRDGYYHRCKSCSKLDQLKYRGRRQQSARRAAKYKCTEQDLLNMLRDQKYICPLCNERLMEDWHIDHCHSSGKIRGLVHPRCNTSLGFYEKNILPNIDRYINYLEGNI